LQKTTNLLDEAELLLLVEQDANNRGGQISNQFGTPSKDDSNLLDSIKPAAD